MADCLDGYCGPTLPELTHKVIGNGLARLETEVGRKYIKIVQYMVVGGVRERGNSVWMFVNNKTGECLKPASWRGPAKGVRFMIDFLANNCHVCDPYGSFLYL